MTIKDFAALQSRIFDLYNNADFAEALAELNRHTAHFPLHQNTITLWKACLAALTGQGSLARWFLEEGISAGEWWAPQLLADRDLRSLHDDAEFKRLVELCRDRQAEAERDAMPMRLVSEPTAPPPWPALVPLDNGVTFARRWRAATTAGWLLSAPQSTQASGPGRYAWLDRDRAVSEVRAHLLQLSAGARTDPARIVISGYSSAGAFALELPPVAPAFIKGVIAVAPRLDPSDDAHAKRAEALAATGAKLVIIDGRRDVHQAKGSELFAAAFEAAGGVCRVHLDNTLSHDFPADFDSMLPELLAFVDG